MSRVTNNVANQSACLCPVCPVQVDSPCINRKKDEAWIYMRGTVMGGILSDYAKHPETYEIPIAELKAHPVGQKHDAGKLKEEDMIELYCSIGKSACPDLSTEEPCLCPDCSVWRGHELKSRYYCLQGRADAASGDAGSG